MVCQTFACLEVIHPLIGLVKTGVMPPLMQVYFIVFIALHKRNIYTCIFPLYTPGILVC